MNKPLISIIIPIYNGLEYLPRCFKTLKDQFYSNLELIFVDNGSTDGSLIEIKSFCEQIQYAYLYNCKIKGPGYARNKGIEVANGDYISFLDVDDEISRDKHQILLNEFIKYPNAGMVVAKTLKKYKDGRSYTLDFPGLADEVTCAPNAGLVWLNNLSQNPTSCSYMVRGEIFKDGKIRFGDILHGEDIAFNVSVGLDYDIIKIDKTICTYHRHEKSAVSNANNQVTSLERYFSFYENFILKYLVNNKNIEPYKTAFKLCEIIAFRILMRLIYQKKIIRYKNVYNQLRSKNIFNNLFYYHIIYCLLPFRLSNFIFQKLI